MEWMELKLVPSVLAVLKMFNTVKMEKMMRKTAMVNNKGENESENDEETDGEDQEFLDDFDRTFCGIL